MQSNVGNVEAKFIVQVAPNGHNLVHVSIVQLVNFCHYWNDGGA